MNRCFCDRCGKEIKEKSAGYVATNRRDRKNGDLQLKNKFEEKDFCVTCMNEIEKFIKTNPEAMKVEMGMTQNAVAVQICTYRKRQVAEKGAQDE